MVWKCREIFDRRGTPESEMTLNTAINVSISEAHKVSRIGVKMVNKTVNKGTQNTDSQNVDAQKTYSERIQAVRGQTRENQKETTRNIAVNQNTAEYKQNRINELTHRMKVYGFTAGATGFFGGTQALIASFAPNPVTIGSISVPVIGAVLSAGAFALSSYVIYKSWKERSDFKKQN